MITSISKNDNALEVVVVTKSGYPRIILEGKSRLSKGSWVPKAVKHIPNPSSEQVTTVTFRIEMTETTEMLRARAEKSTPLPPSFYGGQSEFNASKSANLESVAIDDATRFETPESGADGGKITGNDREVQESDIWAFRGNTLYFFNRLQGLQIIDVSDPKGTRILKRFNMPAAGEEMYVLDDAHVGLLVRDYCGFYSEKSGNQVVIVDTASEIPEITGTVHIPGSIVETRLVGDVLYTAASEYKTSIDAEGKTIWTSGTSITSIQLSDPSKPEKVADIFVPGYTSAVQATDAFFFVGTRGSYPFYNSELHITDISNPNGSLQLESTIKVNGWIKDKFKINLNNHILSIISEVRGQNGRILNTELINYSIKNPSKPDRAGSLRLGKNESLFATRFDGDRIYIVTFLRIDPLWIVDNTNPYDPQILGELEIPGWSTFIHPMGDKLITMGIDNVGGWKPAVQLFDVSDPANPTLSSKIPLGETWAWSEANQTEKAFKVFESEGLILVPVSAWLDEENLAGTQLIDFNDTTLTKRGLIEHEFTPRRATMFNDLVYSISNHELVTVNPDDRDNPRVISELDLALQSDTVVEYQDYLISGFTSYNNSSSATLTLINPSDTSTVISQYKIEPDETDPASGYRLSNLFVHNGAIFAVTTSEPYAINVDESREKGGQPEYYTSVKISSFVLNENKNALVKVSELKHPSSGLGWHPSLEHHILPNGDLTLFTNGINNFHPFLDDFIGRPGLDFRGYQKQLFLTFNIEGQVVNNFSSLFIPGFDDESNHNTWRSFSGMFWSGDRVIFSSQTSRYKEMETTLDKEQPAVNSDIQPPPPLRIWTTDHQLINISFSDPVTPTQFPAIEIPGKLIGISHQGQVIYTSGYSFDDDGGRIPNSLHLHASAYDEVQVSLVDSMPLTSNLAGTLSLDSGIIISRHLEDGLYEITPLKLLNSGELIFEAGFSHDSYPHSLIQVDGLVLIPNNFGSGITAVDFNAGSKPVIFEEWNFPGCVYAPIKNISGTKKDGFWSPMGVYGINHLAPPSN